ncbi:MAG: zinc-binding dehydrogenase [Chloroflexi bacterium]|nr:zinc-binding dehydrogenase [Chloroflexota bacterium]
MRASQVVAPRRVEIIDVPLPSLEPGHVLVRTRYLGICGSDRPHVMHPQPEELYPLPVGYPGHECIGMVEESRSPDFAPGDRVLVLPPGMNLFQEYLAVDPQDFLMKLPEDMDFRTLGLVQPLGTVIHCCLKWGNILGKDAVVLGQGPIGLLFTAMLRTLGARRIIAVDPLAYRLKAAQMMGATDIVLGEGPEVIIAVEDLTGGALADLVVEACGLEITYNLAFELVKRRGTVTLFGVPKKNPMTMLVTSMFRKEAVVINSVGPDKHSDMPLSLWFIQQGRVDVIPLPTHLLPFEHIQEAFEMAEEKRDGVIKVTLEV